MRAWLRYWRTCKQPRVAPLTDPTETFERHQQGWCSRLAQLAETVPEVATLRREGQLRRMVGLTLEAAGCDAAVGDLCSIKASNSPGGKSAADIGAEVVGFAEDRLFLMPTGRVHGLIGNMRVRPLRRGSQVGVGEALLGRIIDGAGHPLDERGAIDISVCKPLQGDAINPLRRAPIRQVLDVGVRSVNSLLTIGRGQRVGLFAGSGVGKSVLLGMMTRFTEAEVVVVGLIGERGREVREFIEQNIGTDGMQRTVVVASPADDPPLLRLHGAMRATAIAEYFRDRGKHVLLLMDSLTRFAQAQREIALSIGEPPVTRGYPPSVFSKLPQLCERAGNGGDAGGSITALYTVLAEGDDQNDPVVDAARAILDGHIVLSREIAGSGIFPAIDITGSVSRTMGQVVGQGEFALARQLRSLIATYRENEDLLNIGAYQPGSNPPLDLAIARWPAISQFLQQDADSPADYNQSLNALRAVIDGPASVGDSPVDA